MYKCSPECLRPVVEDEQVFRQLAQEYHTGVLAPELEVPRRYMGPGGHFVDLTAQPPTDEDFDLLPSPVHDPPDLPENPAPTLSPEHWEGRAADLQEFQNELGQLPSPRPLPSTRPATDLPQEGERQKSRRLDEPEAPPAPSAETVPIPDTMSELSYSPSLDPERAGKIKRASLRNLVPLSLQRRVRVRQRPCAVKFLLTSSRMMCKKMCLVCGRRWQNAPK
eukprot:s1267_g1.t1